MVLVRLNLKENIHIIFGKSDIEFESLKYFHTIIMETRTIVSKKHEICNE